MNTSDTISRILLVDDEPMVRDFLELALISDGFQVECCADGTEAMRRLTEGTFGLVITDYLMPELRGDQLAASIKSRRPELPVVLISGNSENFDTAEFTRCPIDGFLEKPVTMERIRQVARQFLPNGRS